MLICCRFMVRGGTPVQVSTRREPPMGDSSVNRREFLKTTATGAAAAGIGANIIIPGRSHAAKKTLRILNWVHFVPAYDEWFNKKYVVEWGQKNDTEVTVDNIGSAGVNPRAAAEVSAQKGHDLFLFNWPPPSFEEQTVDMKDVYAELERTVGKPIDLAVKSTYNPKTKKYYALSPAFTPDPVNYRQDLFGEVGLPNGPKTWDEVRTAGAKVKKQFNNAVGIGLANEIDTGMATRPATSRSTRSRRSRRSSSSGRCSRRR